MIEDPPDPARTALMRDKNFISLRGDPFTLVAFTGWLMRSITLPQLFVGCGGLLVCLALGVLLGSPIRQVSDQSGLEAQ